MGRNIALFAVIAMVVALVGAVPALAFEVSGPNFEDQETESGEIESETEIAIDGNNNNQCAGLLQFGQTGNFPNQQGTTQVFTIGGDNEFAGPETEFGPENETECEQEVQQAAAASSWGG